MLNLEKDKQRVIIFVANRSFALSNSRQGLIDHYERAGWKVVTASDCDFGVGDGGNLGHTEEVTFARSGASFFKDTLAFVRLFWIYFKFKPELVHHFNAKPVILGSIAAKLTFKNIIVINTITGLGHAFLAGGSDKRLAGIGYKTISYLSSVTVFQNSDDLDLFLKNSWVSEQKSVLIKGSGVDLNRFSSRIGDKSEGDGSVTILMVARLIRQKGIIEFFNASKILDAANVNTKFVLVGELDTDHPDGISEEELSRLLESSRVTYKGFVNSIHDMYKTADIFCLPSYREGLPRAIIEASAVGIPSVAADVPGSREVILNSQTGFLVPARSSELLAEKLLMLVSDNELRSRLGSAAKEFVCENFSTESIIEQQVKLHSTCLEESRNS